MARGNTTDATTMKIARTVSGMPFPGGWTMMAWSRVHGSMTNSLNGLFDLHRVGTSSAIGVYVDTSGGLGAGCGIFTVSGDYWENISSIGNAWTDFTNYHHFAVTMSSPNSSGGAFLKFFLDGEMSKTINSLVGITQDYDEIAAYGCVTGGIPSARCYNQHFRFWNRPLSPNEIRDEKRSRFPVSRLGLFADLPLHYDNFDTVARAAWTEGGTGGSIVTEVGPILGGLPNPQLILASRSLAPRKWIFGAH